MLDKAIERILRRHVNCHNVGVYARNEIKPPGKKFARTAYVINTDPSYKRGKHWVAIYIDKNREGYYFDSYGLPPSHREFLRFLKKHTEHWSYNDENFQGLLEETCGQFCLYFLIKMSREHSFLKNNRLKGNNFKSNNKLVKNFLKNL